MTDDMNMQTGDDLATAALEEANQSESTTSINPSSTATNSNDDIGEALTSLQNIIERNASELDEVKETMKQYREELKNVFDNDMELSDAEEQATSIAVRVKDRKSKLMGSPQVTQLKSQIGELTERKKEIEEALNNHLLNLYQITGTKTFDTSDGRQREFNVRASLKGGAKKE